MVKHKVPPLLFLKTGAGDSKHSVLKDCSIKRLFGWQFREKKYYLTPFAKACHVTVALRYSTQKQFSVFSSCLLNINPIFNRRSSVLLNRMPHHSDTAVNSHEDNKSSGIFHVSSVAHRMSRHLLICITFSVLGEHKHTSVGYTLWPQNPLLRASSRKSGPGNFLEEKRHLSSLCTVHVK